MNYPLAFLVLMLIPVFVTAAPKQEDYTRLAGEVEKALQRDIINAWFPHCIDKETGGFHANWSRDWKKQPSSGKMIVHQARQTWISAQIAMRRPEKRDEFLAYTRHGLKFLKDVMWDKDHGGFYMLVTDDGKPHPSMNGEKHAYGIAFGLYAAAAAFEATKDEDALDLAKRTFEWLDVNAHDPTHGGYFENLTADGANNLGDLQPPSPRSPRSRFGVSPYGFKSMNAHIHLLEAVAQLYKVHKDEKVKARLDELLKIVRDRIAVNPGCLHLYFNRDWTPVPDHDSYGHDIETAFLMLEAEEILGTHDEKTRGMAHLLVQHTLDWAFNERTGGFAEKGYALAPAYDLKRVWWTQVEALNALLMMHELEGKETDRFWNAFVRQWEWIKTKQIDPEHPGLFPEVEPDGKPAQTAKGHNWKAAYHDGRTLLLVTERLNRLAQQK